DSSAIVRWLDKSYASSLTPSAMDAIAAADGWMGWTTQKLYPRMRSLTPGAPMSASATEYERRTEQSRLLTALRDAERLFPRGNAWLVGNIFSYADVAMAPVLAAVDDAVRETFPLRVRAYAERLRARASIRE